MPSRDDREDASLRPTQRKRADRWPLVLVGVLAAILVFGVLEDQRSRDSVPASATGCESEQGRAFDFLLEPWGVILVRRSSEGGWPEGVGRRVGRSHAGGCVIVDRYSRSGFSDEGGEIEGVAVRVFDPNADLWSIVSFDSRGASAIEPLVGRFTGAVGMFRSDERVEEARRRIVIWDNSLAREPRRIEFVAGEGGEGWRLRSLEQLSKTGRLDGDPTATLSANPSM